MGNKFALTFFELFTEITFMGSVVCSLVVIADMVVVYFKGV